MKLLGLSGGLSQATVVAIEKALDFAYQYDNSISIELLNIGEYDVRFCDGRDPAKYEGDTRLAIDKIVEADALLIGTPMYRGSYSGMLKNMFDLIPNDALMGKPIGLIATGGSDHHYLAIEHELKPIMGFFHAYAIPGCVYINNTHYSERDLIDENILIQLKQLAQSVINFENILPSDKSSILGAVGPTIYRKAFLKKAS